MQRYHKTWKLVLWYSFFYGTFIYMFQITEKIQTAYSFKHVCIRKLNEDGNFQITSGTVYVPLDQVWSEAM